MKLEEHSSCVGKPLGCTSCSPNLPRFYIKLYYTEIHYIFLKITPTTRATAKRKFDLLITSIITDQHRTTRNPLPIKIIRITICKDYCKGCDLNSVQFFYWLRQQSVYNCPITWRIDQSDPRKSHYLWLIGGNSGSYEAFDWWIIHVPLTTWVGMGYCPGFLLKIGRLRTFGNSPEIFTSNR